MSKYLLVILPIIALVFVLVGFDMLDAYRTSRIQITAPAITHFWEKQCVDTMKFSRDSAREHLNNLTRAEEEIEREVNLVSQLGANCIAIATPYDEEFMPVLRIWVAHARNHGLSIWFRGNFSSWEGWFNYPKNLTPELHLELTRDFIQKNPDIFKDGDIFTGAPEAENGGPFAGNQNASIFESYSSFITAEYLVAEQSFKQIGKKVTTNWFSMNGWIARNMLQRELLDEIGNNVTIDHYTKDLQGMDEYIQYFKKNFNSTVTLGEFGAPIPDLNGKMTEEEQARFVSDLMKLLYRSRGTVKNLNYWTLRFGTTALVNSDFTTRKAYETVQRYYSPGVVYGRVLNSIGQPQRGARVVVSTYDTTVTTDSQGMYAVVLPAGTSTITYRTLEGSSRTEEVTLQSGERHLLNLRITPAKAGLLTKIRGWYRDIAWNLP